MKHIKDIRMRFDRASQRRQHRLTAPLDVNIKDHTYTALDWSTAGIRLRREGDEEGFVVDETLTLDLSVPFQSFNVTLKLIGRVVRVDSVSEDVALVFIDPPQRATELLRYFADHLIRGEMAPIDGTIQRLDLPVTPPAPKPPTKQVQGKSSSSQAARSLFIGSSYLMAGVVIAIGLYYTLYTNFFLVTSDQALTYTPTVDVIVPEGGEVSAVYVTEGDQVAVGDPLLRLESPRVDHLLSEARMEMRTALNERRRLQTAIKVEEDTLDTYRQISKDQVAMAEARLAAAKTEQSSMQQQYERVSQLSWQGMVSAQEFDRVKSNLQHAKDVVTEAQGDLRIAQSALKAAQMGAYYSSNRLESRLPGLQSDLASAKDRIELAQSRLLEIQKQAVRLVLRAPVTGRVRQVAIPAGGAVMAGSQAVSLLTDQTLQVYTKIPSDELGRIAVGDMATVYVPALSRNLNARVAAVEPRLWSLPNNVRRLFGDPNDGGLVVLNFEGATSGIDAAQLNPGLPVSVQLKNNTVHSAIRRVAGLFHGTNSNMSNDSIVPVSSFKKVTLAEPD